MPSAQSSLPDSDLLMLAFLAGFAVATLIFWPMLRRKRSRDNMRRPTGGEGRHALRESSAAKPVRKSADAHAAAASSPPDAGAVAVAEPRTTDSTTRREPVSPGLTDSPTLEVPEPRAQEPIELPPPADLYQQHYAARFNRARNRIARIREQLDQP